MELSGVRRLKERELGLLRMVAEPCNPTRCGAIIQSSLPMSDPIDPRDLLAVLFRHKKKMLLSGLLVMGAAVAATALMQPRFRSQAMLFVRLGRENVALDPTASMGGGSVVAIPQMREDEINSVVEILRSRTLAERIVDKLEPHTILGRTAAQPQAATPVTGPGPTSDSVAANLGPLEMYARRLMPGPELSPREAAIEKLGKLLTVWAPKRSNVVCVSYDGPSPERAQQVVTQLIDLYLEDHVRLNRTAGSHNFFVEQTDQIRDRLTNTETQLRDLKNQTGMAAVEEQRKILVDRAGRLEDDVLRSTTELASLDAELVSLNEKLDHIPETRVTQRVSGLPNQAADLMRQQLYTLQLKEQELLSVFKADARQVQEIRRQIDEARGILAKEELERTQSTNGADPNFQQLQLSLHSKQTQAASLRARVDKSGQQLVQAKTALTQLNDDEMRIVQLRRDVEIQQSNYRKYAENLEQARIDQALKLERISNICVAQPATLEPRQVRPQPLVQLGAGLLASIVFGVGLAFVAEYFDRSIRSTRDLEQQLELIPLASIPSLPESVAKAAPIREKYAHAIPR